MDCVVHEVTKSQTRLSNFHFSAVYFSKFLSSCSVAQSCLTLSTPWIVTHQAPLSMGFFQARIQEWAADLSSRKLPDPGVEPILLHCRQILYC